MAANNDDGSLHVTLIRHGQTGHNIKRIMQGHLDTDLNGEGLHQAHLCGLRLKNDPIDEILSSDLKRCRQTTEEIAKFHPGLHPHYTSDLRERCLGELQGLHVNDVVAKTRAEHKTTKDYGEPASEFRHRLLKFWDDYITSCEKRHLHHVVLVSHGGAISTLSALLQDYRGFRLSNEIPLDAIKIPHNTSITEIMIPPGEKSGTFELFGDTTHLTGKTLEEVDQIIR